MDQVPLTSFKPAKTLLRGEPFDVRRPRKLRAPFVWSSPHSGRDYPPSFLAASKLDALTIRRSEDSYVDELFAEVPGAGMPLIAANFPRAYVDLNREPYELDPEMFVGTLPSFVNTRSLRVAGGLGTIARVVADGKEIYRHKLTFEEAQSRIEELYEPYHGQVREMIADAHHRFGTAVLVDCHSMPSVGGPMDQDAGLTRADVVLGDRHGTSCASALTHEAENIFKDLGLTVGRNTPYAGGYTTERYGKPMHGIHALQIELNRGLYMNEATLAKKPRFDDIKMAMSAFAETLAQIDLEPLSPVL